MQQYRYCTLYKLPAHQWTVIKNMVYTSPALQHCCQQNLIYRMQDVIS
jgi:hypothetical protein